MCMIKFPDNQKQKQVYMYAHWFVTLQLKKIQTQLSVPGCLPEWHGSTAVLPCVLPCSVVIPHRTVPLPLQGSHFPVLYKKATKKNNKKETKKQNKGQPLQFYCSGKIHCQLKRQKQTKMQWKRHFVHSHTPVGNLAVTWTTRVARFGPLYN